MDNCCVICLDEKNKNDSCMVWWCEHEFHKSCMVEMLKYNENGKKNCPLCRKRIDNILDLSDENEVNAYFEFKEYVKNKNESEDEDDSIRSEISELISNLSECGEEEYDKVFVDNILEYLREEYSL